MASEGLEAIWESSRQNDWSFALPLVLNIGTAVFVLLAFIPLRWLRWTLNVFAVVAIVYFSIDYSSMEIEEKWRIRNKWINENRDSLTDKERSAGTVDGANRVLGPILIGGQSAIFRSVIVLITLAIARVVVTGILKRMPNRNPPYLEFPPNYVDTITESANPYLPPNTLVRSPRDAVE